MTTLPELEAVVRAQLTRIASFDVDDEPGVTEAMNRACDRVLQAARGCITAETARALGEIDKRRRASPRKEPLVHLLLGDLAIACNPSGKARSSPWREQVTCEGCKATDAWKAAA